MAPERGPDQASDKGKQVPKEKDKGLVIQKPEAKEFLDTTLQKEQEERKEKGFKLVQEVVGKLANSPVLGEMVDLLKQGREVELEDVTNDLEGFFPAKIDRNNKRFQFALLMESTMIDADLSPEMRKRYDKGEITPLDLFKMTIDKKFADRINSSKGTEATKWKKAEGIYHNVLAGVEKTPKTK